MRIDYNSTLSSAPTSPAPTEQPDTMWHYAILLLATLSVCPLTAFADGPAGPSFRHDVMAVLSKSGCNLGTCHGNQKGKGGLKLSLRGQHPDRDLETLARGLQSRRVNTLHPTASLLLQKPTMAISHGGGQRFQRDSVEYNILRDWIAAGTPADPPDARRLQALTVSPRHATVPAIDGIVHLSAIALFSDGTQRDVTELALFEPSSLFVTVTSGGTVASERPGLSTVTVRYLDQQVPVRLEFVPERTDFQWADPQAENFVDDAIFSQMRRMKTNPSPVCDDTTFLRRAYLDVTGLLPSIEAARTFIASDDPNKRAVLIDQLLASKEYSDFQALRWADLLRVEEKTLSRKGVDVFHEWIRHSFETGKPLNEFVAEIITARGSTYAVPPANFYRALRDPSSRGEAAAQVFLGIRLQCAKCHNHPFGRWTQEDYYGWSSYFARIDYEIGENKRRDKLDKHEFTGDQTVVIKAEGDVTNPDTGNVAGLRLLGDLPEDAAASADDAEKPDRLERLAQWLTSPDNRQFAAMQTNRIWYQLMGRGLVDPIDDFRSTNPPTHPELLEQLTDEFIAHDYDVRHLMRFIMNSRTYQLASTTNDSNSGDETGYSHALPSRLTAEQTLDAIAQVLEAPIKFGGHDAGTKAVQLRGVRDGGHRHSPPEIGDRFLTLFGKPGRLQTCECERDNSTTLAQTFEMVSGDLINELLAGNDNRIARAVAEGSANEMVIDDLYWSALSRPPTPLEKSESLNYVSTHSNRKAALEDLSWALLNSNEFLLRR